MVVEVPHEVLELDEVHLGVPLVLQHCDQLL